MRFRNRVPGPDRSSLLYCTLLHDVRVCIRIYLPAAVYCVAIYTAVAAAAAVRHRVPDGNICCCGSLHLIPVFSFS